MPTKDTPVTLGMLRALLIASRRFPGAPGNTIPYLIAQVIDGDLRLDPLTGRLEEVR